MEKNKADSAQERKSEEAQSRAYIQIQPLRRVKIRIYTLRAGREGESYEEASDVYMRHRQDQRASICIYA